MSLADSDIKTDIVVPNTGRILDYWLGGEHHHPIEAGAAQAFDGIYDRFPEVFRVLRDFMGRSVRYVERKGVRRFVVFGSGIPTQGNVHESVPRSKVFYTDIDEENVRLGRKILAGSTHARYGFCDASNLSTLNEKELERALGDSGRLGNVVVGVAAFLDDEELRTLFEELWQRSQPGSYLIFDFDSRQLASHPAALELLGERFFMREPDDFAPLLGEWQLTPDGIRPAAAWRNRGNESDLPVFMYGGVACKP